jgi:hypothetical protein
MGAKRNANSLLVGKPEGKGPPDQDVKWWIILKWVLETGLICQYSDQWKALVNTVMNRWVP